MSDEEPVVWPDDPAEGEPAADVAEPAKPADPWAGSFEEALKQSRAEQEPATPPPAPGAATNEYPTQHSLPAIPAKTQPPTPAEPPETVPPEPASVDKPVTALGMPDEMPTSTFKTPLPAPLEASAANGGEAAIQEAPPAEPDPELVEEKPELEAEAEADAEPAAASEPEAIPEPEPVSSEEEEEPAPEPAVEPEPEPEPVKAPEPEPEPAPKEEEWIPLPANPPVPSWAPQLGAAAQAAEQKVDWPGSNLPSWAPVGGGRSTSNMPAATRISSSPAPGASQPPAPAAPSSGPAAQAPSQPPAPAPPASQPGAAEPAKGKTSSWEIVPPKVSDQQKTAYAGPTAEDKSYAEWFAWAKRSGAPATACHAAAQGAFRALAAGHDMNTAVQWATIAMGSPPGLVSASRQLYCAWYSLGNIDLRLPSPQAHSFAAGSIAALEAGADAPTAHQAGLAAAGITG